MTERQGKRFVPQHLQEQCGTNASLQRNLSSLVLKVGPSERVLQDTRNGVDCQTGNFNGADLRNFNLKMPLLSDYVSVSRGSHTTASKSTTGVRRPGIDWAPLPDACRLPARPRRPRL